MLRRYFEEGEYDLVVGQKLIYMPDQLGSHQRCDSGVATAALQLLPAADPGRCTQDGSGDVHCTSKAHSGDPPSNRPAPATTGIFHTLTSGFRLPTLNRDWKRQLRGLNLSLGLTPMAGFSIAGEALEGAEMGIEIVAQDGTKITGYTEHAIDRAVGNLAERAGTKAQSILDALKNPQKIISGVDAQGRPFKVFTGYNARVVVNPETGKVVSVNPTSGAGVR